MRHHNAANVKPRGKNVSQTGKQNIQWESWLKEEWRILFSCVILWMLCDNKSLILLIISLNFIVSAMVCAPFSLGQARLWYRVWQRIRISKAFAVLYWWGRIQIQGPNTSHSFTYKLVWCCTSSQCVRTWVYSLVAKTQTFFVPAPANLKARVCS